MKSHRFDPVSFISGVIITLLGLAFLIPQTPVDLIDAVTSLGSWFWPVILLVVGIAVLVPVFARRSEEVDAMAPLPASGIPPSGGRDIPSPPRTVLPRPIPRNRRFRSSPR